MKRGMHNSIRFPPRGLLTGLLAAALLAGCASGGGGAGDYPTSVALLPSPEAAPDSIPAALPALPVSQAESSLAGRRIDHLEVINEELPRTLRALATSFGLDYEIAPQVSGRVSVSLHGVTLQEALDAIVSPHGFSYELQERVLRVGPARVQTRIFALEYLAISRVGVATTVVQRRFGERSGIGANNNLVGGGFNNGFGGGADVIQSVSVADLWEEIRVALEALVFDARADTIGSSPILRQENNQFGGMGRAPSPYSRVGSDGRKVIINPMAGTILVGGSPEKLAEVAAYLATIEAAVRRQVLIEAKIAEVSLNRDFQFGVDWNVVRQVGEVRLSFANTPGQPEFRMGRPNLTVDPDDPDAEPVLNTGNQVDVVLRALQQQGEVRVLSSPRVSGLNNQRAVISVATDRVFFTITRQPVLGPNGVPIGFTTEVEPQQIAVGIVLDVLPQISADNTITLNVRPVITDIIAEEQIALEDGTRFSAPVIDRRETDTVVRVRSGETLVIGGLMQTRQSNSRGGIPLLRDIPVLGALFGSTRQNRETRELVIFITPTIVAGQPPIGS